MSEAASDRPSLLEYAQVPLRRPWHVAIPFVVVTLLAVGLSLLIAKSYTSSTLILVESAKVPESFLNEGAARDSAAARPRLQTIRQEILSRTRLERILEELNPYPERSGRAPLTSIVESMRGNIAINVKGNDSFTIEYTHRDPKMAQAVTERLATLFIEESNQARKTQVEVTGEFIESQLLDARRQLEEKEKALRQYKESRMGRLPEQTGANLAILQRLQLEQQSVSDSLRSARERVLLIERGVSAAAAAPGSNDPRRRAGDRAQRAREPARPLHGRAPRRAALQGRVTRLERQVAQRATSPQGDVQLEQARAEVRHLEGKLADVDRRIAIFQGRVEDTPRTEQELATLTRDYEQLNQAYLDLLKKKMDAQMAEKLENRWKTDNFRILDPAYLPERPVSPNRWLYLWARDGPGPAGRPGRVASPPRCSTPRSRACARWRRSCPSRCWRRCPGSTRPLRCRHGWHRSGATGPDAAAAPPRASRRSATHMDEMFDPKALLKTMGRPPRNGACAEEGGSIDIEFEAPAADPGPALEVRVEVTPRRPSGPVAALTAGGPVTEELRLLRAKLRAIDAERGLQERRRRQRRGRRGQEHGRARAWPRCWPRSRARRCCCSRRTCAVRRSRRRSACRACPACRSGWRAEGAPSACGGCSRRASTSCPRGAPRTAGTASCSAPSG